MDVVFINPTHPVEMQDFARGLQQVGARVWGVGDSPQQALPDKVKSALTGYLQVPRLMDERDTAQRIIDWLGGRRPDRVESCWEPTVLTAARVRDALGVPGMSYDTVLGFRDKQLMKERVAAAGVRVPKSERVRTTTETRAAAERIGYPLILKPIAGAGSAHTFRCDDAKDLEYALDRMGHVAEASCEEFIEAVEYTYDTLCVDGRPVYENVSEYIPRPLQSRTHEWISPIILTFRDLTDPRLTDGIAQGHQVLQALGMERGFTHMEWYRKPDGEVIFGEIGCRPGGARLVDQMNVGSDHDFFVEWARAIVHGEVRAPAHKNWLTALVIKRAKGRGQIRHIDGLDAFKQRYGSHVVFDELLRPGQQRRDWMQTLLSDGFLLLRHPDERTIRALADEAARTIEVYAS